MIRSIQVGIIAAVLVLSGPAVSFGQLTAARTAPIAYGHHHLNVTSIDEHKKFWIAGLGGASGTLEGFPREMIKFPNVLVFLRQQKPTGGTKTTSVDHLGFQVPNVRAVVDRLRAAGYPIVTKAELPPVYEEKDGLAFIPDQNTYIAFVMGPDETKVELVENKALTMPIAMHHVHFFSPQVEEMRAWYVKTFDAKPGKRGAFQAADVAGANLTYSQSRMPVAGTKGRVLDHIGFEVKDLKALVARLGAMGITVEDQRSPLPTLHVAFLTDPWGTFIELTQGLDKVQ